MTRGDCAPAAAERASGAQSCAFLNCRYHLTGGLGEARVGEDATHAMIARLRGRYKHTCALDIADEGRDIGNDIPTCAAALGTSKQAMSITLDRILTRIRVRTRRATT